MRKQRDGIARSKRGSGELLEITDRQREIDTEREIFRRGNGLEYGGERERGREGLV